MAKISLQSGFCGTRRVINRFAIALKILWKDQSRRLTVIKLNIMLQDRLVNLADTPIADFPTSNLKQIKACLRLR